MNLHSFLLGSLHGDIPNPRVSGVRPGGMNRQGHPASVPGPKCLSGSGGVGSALTMPETRILQWYWRNA